MYRVIARIFGGIGNQLFCYAAARRLALVNNAELVIDSISGFVRDQAYRRQYQLDHFHIPCRKATPSERLDPFSRARRYVLLALNRHRPFDDRTYIQQEGIDFDARLLKVKVRGTIYVEGYWQSEGYFKDVEEMIRADLRMRPPSDPTNLGMVTRIRDSLAVAVHVRFFNGPNEGGSHNTPAHYYPQAVAEMETVAPGAHYFVFSDQPQAARAHIPLPDERITCVSHNQGDANAYADLWLMTQCRHFIIANSTFSWWGAWLSSHPGKIVIAPATVSRSGICAWGFEGLIPHEWRQM